MPSRSSALPMQPLCYCAFHFVVVPQRLIDFPAYPSQRWRLGLEVRSMRASSGVSQKPRPVSLSQVSKQPRWQNPHALFSSEEVP